MINLSATLANSLWYISNIPGAIAFHRAARNVAEAQQRLLMDIVVANAHTAFGRQYHFTGIQSVADFQHHVPLSTYDDYSSAIDEIAAGSSNILTAEPVTLFEPTSGSTNATKLIPYTASLQKAFQHGIAPWFVNLFHHYPTLIGGQAYWSISPLLESKQYTSCGIPIGFEDDSSYLGHWSAKLINSVMAVPSWVKLIQDMDTFRYVTLLFLLKSHSLRFISVWNPTFLTILLDYLETWGEQLVVDIATGTCHSPGDIDPTTLSRIRRGNKPDLPWARDINHTLHHVAPTERYRYIWPHLKLVSCWADAAAAPHAQQLHNLLPHTEMQGKGLIATEAFVSLPLVNQTGAMLAVNSHFFEFIDSSGHISLAHELQPGQEYQVVVTTDGGLYRYQLYDTVEALGGLHIRFVGRSANIADHFGEKVSEGHVRHSIQTMFTKPPRFALLSPEIYSDGSTSYTLFVDADLCDPLHSTALLEEKLCENFHYHYCRRLGQLAPARVIAVGKSASDDYIRACADRGQRLGDIKPTILDRHGMLLAYFCSNQHLD